MKILKTDKTQNILHSNNKHYIDKNVKINIKEYLKCTEKKDLIKSYIFK